MKSINLIFPFALAILLMACNGQTPDDIQLNPITQSTNGVEINWTQSLDGNFSSYKLYRHTTSGIDESNGVLIHVATDISLISFTDDDFDPQETYYYRVFVLNDNGASGGSNIHSITTQTISLLENGSFELGNSVPDSWTIVQNDLNEPLNSITLNQSYSSDGLNSLNFHHNSSSGCWEMWISQLVSLSDLTPGGTYEFSYSYRSDTQITPGGMGFSISNETMNTSVSLPIFSGDGNWYNFSNQFTLPANIGNNDAKFMIHFCAQGIIDWQIDNISVIKV